MVSPSEQGQYFCCRPGPMSCSAPGNGARVRPGFLSGRAAAGRSAYSPTTSGRSPATPTAPLSTKHICSPSSPIRRQVRGRLPSRAKAPTTGKLANGWHRSTSWLPRLSRLSSSRSASSVGCAIGPILPTLVPMVLAAGSGSLSCFRRDDRGAKKDLPKIHLPRG